MRTGLVVVAVLIAIGGSLSAQDNNSRSAVGQTENIERAKLEFEKWKTEEDFKIKREDLELKRRDLSRSSLSSPLFLAILGILASIIAALVQNFLQSRANRNLERQRFESGLIQKAVETSDQQAAADRLKFLLRLGLIADTTGRIAEYVENPGTIPVQPQSDDFFRAVSRRAARLSIGSGPVEVFKNLSSLIASLPSDAAMASHDPPITRDSDSNRVAEEQRNVRVRACLYAASKKDSNDYHMVIGPSAGSKSASYMTVIVSGLPPKDSPAFSRLKAARDACKAFFGDNLPSAGYHFYSPPIPVEVEGSLFFNVTHLQGPKPGPASLRKGLKTLWEIRPVTQIVFEPELA
jgi:hypothetical protein